MNLSQKKWVIADVDETICRSCKKISTEMAEKISSMIRQGYQFAFISGTKTTYLLDLISSGLSEKHHLLSTTGTCCVKVNPGQPPKEIYKHTLSELERKEIIAALKKLVEVFEIPTMTTLEDQVQDRETQVTLSAIGRSAPVEVKEKYDPEGIKRKEWVKYLKTLIDFNNYEVTVAGTTSIDITRKGLDKGWGIKTFAHHYGISLNTILFIGDKTYLGGNDYAATKVVDYWEVKSPADTLEKLKQNF